jgi:glutamate racemase
MAFHGINVKLMKTGSLSRAVEMLRLARAAGLKTMIGCMVETSVGISAAMELESLADYMDLDGFMLLQEEPFRLVEEKGGRVFLKN